MISEGCGAPEAKIQKNSELVECMKSDLVVLFGDSAAKKADRIDLSKSERMEIAKAAFEEALTTGSYGQKTVTEVIKCTLSFVKGMDKKQLRNYAQWAVEKFREGQKTKDDQFVQTLTATFNSEYRYYKLEFSDASWWKGDNPGSRANFSH